MLYLWLSENVPCENFLSSIILWLSFCLFGVLTPVQNQHEEPKEGGECSAEEGGCLLWWHCDFALYGSLWACCSKDYCYLWVWGEFLYYNLVVCHWTLSWNLCFVGFHAELYSNLKAQTSSMQVQNLTAAYIMKCDDDTFVRVDTVLKEIEGISPNKSLYMGNLNLLHRPLRNGKWAVTYEVFYYLDLLPAMVQKSILT